MRRRSSTLSSEKWPDGFITGSCHGFRRERGTAHRQDHLHRAHPAALREAKEILKEKGVTYVNLVQTEEIKALLPISAYPTSYFVDSEGHVVTSPETGANVNVYAPRIEKALKDME